MSDHPAQEPEDQDPESQLPPNDESPSEAPKSSWWPTLLLAAVVSVVLVGLLLPAITVPRHGATSSAKQIQVEREREIAEAMRLAGDADRAR